MFLKSKLFLIMSNPNGGWGDIRDHELCLLNAKFPHNTSNIILPNNVRLKNKLYLDFESILQI